MGIKIVSQPVIVSLHISKQTATTITEDNMLKQTFFELTDKYTDDIKLKNKLWNELNEMYSDNSRHYHTLSQLENILSELTEIKDEIMDWETVLFAVFYHDIVYLSTGNKNEEESAHLAELKLNEISFPKEKTTKCIAMILATKGHAQTHDKDTDYFTDADLSVLGQNWELYAGYLKQIRKEYAMYPDQVYNEGRKRIITHFLQMERIFKTKYFYEKYELKARENLLREKDLLTINF